MLCFLTRPTSCNFIPSRGISAHVLFSLQGRKKQLLTRALSVLCVYWFLLIMCMYSCIALLCDRGKCIFVILTSFTMQHPSEPGVPTPCESQPSAAHAVTEHLCVPVHPKYALVFCLCYCLLDDNLHLACCFCMCERPACCAMLCCAVLNHLDCIWPAPFCGWPPVQAGLGACWASARSPWY